jgi:hypothetical protein
MRKILLAASALFLSLSASAQSGYTAHEWGTFTTLSGSDGVLLNGLHRDEEKLPDFTYSHSDVYKEEGAGDDKGFAVQYKLDHVTVKMETPVIYFYTKQEMEVGVKVSFPRGAISQWYPKRSSGEQLPSDLKLDFANPYNGWIQWNTKILATTNEPAYSAPTDQVSPIWQAPRETDANRVQVNGQVEKYLFYRGVANFPLQVKTHFENGKLVVENKGTQNIPYFFVIEQRQGQAEPTIWWTGSINAGQKQTVNPIEPGVSSLTFEGGLNNFRQALVNAGLYEKEAAAMLNTWKKSYFQTPGIRVFWVVPEQIVNEVLPISMTPEPESLKRVLVARSEVLSPAFEEKLKKAFVDGEGAEFYDDRYYLAYKERVEALNAQPSSVRTDLHPELQSQFKIFPNPASNNMRIQWLGPECRDWQITIIDASGKQLISDDNTRTFCKGDTRHFSLNALSKGTYFIRVKGDEVEFNMPFVKQ